MGTKIKLSRQELNWIERTADIETARIFQNFQALLKLNPNEKEKQLIDKQVTELIELYTFLKTLRCKLELWDCRYDIDTEIEYPDKEEVKDSIADKSEVKDNSIKQLLDKDYSQKGSSTKND